jgi:hypothetical protein
MAKRWVCPNCQGGINAPSRMSTDDVRRYCLGCSAITGKLVQRRAPALERARLVSAQRSTVRRKTKAERERQKRIAKVSASVTDREEPVRIDLLLERAWALPTRKAEKVGPEIPDLTVRRGGKPYSSGHVHYDGTITVTIGRVDFAEALAVVLHEAAHEITDLSGRRKTGDHHGVLFRSIFRSLVGDWTGAVVKDHPAGLGVWDFHQAVIAHLREHHAE